MEYKGKLYGRIGGIYFDTVKNSDDWIELKKSVDELNSIRQKFTIKKNKQVQWLPRYSETMEDDKMGRWARVAYAGKFNNSGFYRGKVCRWEIAWIKKFEINGELKFTISYKYPTNGNSLFDNLEDAQK